MRSWLPTRASTNVSLRVTLDRHRLVDLLTPVTAGVDEAVLHVTSDGLVARAADEAHVRSVTATLDADACSQYAVTPGRLALDPTALRAALAADATASAGTVPNEADPVTLAYATDDATLSVTLPTVTHEQPVDPTPEERIPRLSEWPGGATVHHPAGPLREVCDYFAGIAEVIAVEYDASRDAFRIESVDEESGDDAPRAAGTYERSGTELPGETGAATVRAAFDSALLRDLVAPAPADARIRLDVADAHPLRLGWTNTRSDRRGDAPVEVTALLAPRDVSTGTEGDAADDTERDAGLRTARLTCSRDRAAAPSGPPCPERGRRARSYPRGSGAMPAPRSSSRC
jgi:hypothetical protein